ncbi:MAG: prolyl oligopeptidase family serine peptidase [Gemmatimonadales bacterium]
MPVISSWRALGALAVVAFTVTIHPTPTQVGPEDYTRARELGDQYRRVATGAAETPVWAGNSRLWYRKSVEGGHAFMLVDVTNPDAPVKREAFDHVRLAAALNAADSTAEPRASALALPFTAIAFTAEGTALTFRAWDTDWRCPLDSYTCARATVRAGSGQGMPPREVTSPNGRHVAWIANFNVFVREAGAHPSAGVALSTDGSEGNPFTMQSLAWSPDSRRIAAYRVRPGYRRMVRYVESSPADQVQPRTFERFYQKPGDELDLPQPALFDVDARTQVNIDATLFPNPFALSRPVWRRDGRAFTFEYNARGHQRFRVIEVDAATGAARAVIDEASETFIDYRRASGTLTNGGRIHRHDLGDGAEIIWLSERDGWAHLYLYDGRTGRVKHRITRGDFVVRAVHHVDEAARRLIFSAGGMHEGQDPYFAHYYAVNFDGSGLTPLTEAPADHEVVLSPDGSLYVDHWSRVDLAPVTQLRRVRDGRVLLELERGDLTALSAAGWRPPEVFTAVGRDGSTDIWGVAVRPSTFDASRRYPVIEYIYAGPHGSFVPKRFAAWHNMQALAELGFVVVQIDGMGTANRSRSFHDVAWKNLGDAGFPDRILWHRAYAARNPWYDLTRVGIYGGSAGGQNALGGLLFHPEFYHVAVSFAGCHDNRMDKIWWNEQWMGWPIGPEYAASSNVVHAHRLRGELLLIVPELDTNVDPSSTLQVVNALIQADRTFDLLVMPGEDHGGGRRGPSAAYGDRKMWDFFVRHLHGVEPPAWNSLATGSARRATDGAALFGPRWDDVMASGF